MSILSKNAIEISAEPIYLEEESEPHSEQFVWSYQITIQNCSERSIKLRKRHWSITDSNGLTHEIKGDGVVGLEPVVKPGESFSYTSGAVLSAPSGIMFGNYEMENLEGDSFNVSIPAFSLDSPHEKHQFH
ncbi:Co2+/Mg2+ efflux protein ApaG [Alphaproteobacteria bacterium]|nr:Co2+/Mg2+ efflux protein ApaG [Alphaproteobacteria bacterium]